MSSSRSAAVLAACAILALVPVADALTVAARGVKARPSDEYSPSTAWEEGFQGCGVTVAIFDEGVDDAHPYLAGKVVAGYDATVTKEFWTLANGGNPQPISGSHGTPVAGIVASHAGKPFSTPEDAPEYADDDLVGIAPCAWLVDVMFTDLPADTGVAPGDDTFETNVLQAFDWALAHQEDDWGDDDPTNDGIEIITMSWSPDDGTDGTDPICEAASRAVAAGIVVLGSAGNSGANEKAELGCPTGADGVISVANVWNEGTIDREDDVLDDSSTWGPRTDDKDDDPYEELKPDVAAPGTGVISMGAALADGREYAALCLGPRTVSAAGLLPFSCETTFGGTSAATPLTAGVIALMLEANPTLAPADVREILHQTAVRHADMARSAANLSAKWDHRHGYGMIDAHAAVRMAQVWPGMDLGRDLDADGVRDHLDVAPRDPNVADIVKTVSDLLKSAPTTTVDTDGDLVVDASDPDPTDASISEGIVPAAALDEGTRVPGPGLAIVALGALLAARRKRSR